MPARRTRSAAPPRLSARPAAQPLEVRLDRQDQPAPRRAQVAVLAARGQRPPDRQLGAHLARGSSARTAIARSATATSRSCSVAISAAAAQACSQLGSSSRAFSSSSAPIMPQVAAQLAEVGGKRRGALAHRPHQVDVEILFGHGHSGPLPLSERGVYRPVTKSCNSPAGLTRSRDSRLSPRS